MDIPNNDRNLRVVKLLRMEPRETKMLTPSGASLIHGMSPAKDVKVIKGSHDSHSLVSWVTVYGVTPTVSAIPHSMIQGFYAVERTATDMDFFAGPGENEIAADGAMVPTKVMAGHGAPTIGKEAKKWDLNLSHLRPDDGSLD